MKSAVRDFARRAIIGIALLGAVVAAASRPQATGAVQGESDPTLELPAARGSGAAKATAQVIRG